MYNFTLAPLLFHFHTTNGTSLNFRIEKGKTYLHDFGSPCLRRDCWLAGQNFDHHCRSLTRPFRHCRHLKRLEEKNQAILFIFIHIFV